MRDQPERGRRSTVVAGEECGREGLTLAYPRLRPPPPRTLELFGSAARPAITPDLARLERPALILGGVPCANFASTCLAQTDIAYVAIVSRAEDVHKLEGRADVVLVEPASAEEIYEAADRVLAKKPERPVAPPVVDPRRFSWCGWYVDLPKLEARMAHRLVRSCGAVVSRAELSRVLWDYPDDTSRSVDTHIYRLRRRLASIPGIEVVTTRQRGYSLMLDPRAVVNTSRLYSENGQQTG